LVVLVPQGDALGWDGGAPLALNGMKIADGTILVMAEKEKS